MKIKYRLIKNQDIQLQINRMLQKVEKMNQTYNILPFLFEIFFSILWAIPPLHREKKCKKKSAECKRICYTSDNFSIVNLVSPVLPILNILW